MNEYTTVVAMLALIQLIYFTMRTGAARGKYEIDAPATTGNPDFERTFRTHQNSIEQIVIFLPALFSFSYYVSPFWAQVVGVAYIAGRFLYAQAYINSPDKRAPGMIITMLSNAVLVLGTIIGIFVA